MLSPDLQNIENCGCARVVWLRPALGHVCHSYLLVYLSLSPGETASSMVSRVLSTSEEVVVIAGAAPILPTELDQQWARIMRTNKSKNRFIVLENLHYLATFATTPPPPPPLPPSLDDDGPREDPPRLPPTLPEPAPP